ncbi:MAG TPA: alpha/beta hydrolase [Candidatus Saccharimonadales bacterium]|nr:alpha/beta hydrolase [Candidatus Saccharimonadales bacterium]
MNSTLRLKDGSTTHYWEYNSEKRPTIIMVHGFRGTHHGLERIVRQLEDFHVIVPDLPGFGESDPFTKDTHNLDQYVAFVGEFIKQMDGDEKPILLGHSFGSIVASHYAVKKPKTIEKLILINPIGAPALKGSKAALTHLAIFYYWLGRTLPANLSNIWLSSQASTDIMTLIMTKTQDKDMRSFIRDQHRQHFSTFSNPTVVSEAFKASVGHDVREVATQIKVPTLLIAGEKDDVTPLEKQRQLAGLIKGSKLHIIHNVGHLIHYETSDEAATVIQEWAAAPVKP